MYSTISAELSPSIKRFHVCERTRHSENLRLIHNTAFVNCAN